MDKISLKDFVARERRMLDKFLSYWLHKNHEDSYVFTQSMSADDWDAMYAAYVKFTRDQEQNLGIVPASECEDCEHLRADMERLKNELDELKGRYFLAHRHVCQLMNAANKKPSEAEKQNEA